MINFFKLLELPERYNIDITDLDSNYLAMQVKYHPDKALTHEKEKFLSQSMLLNNGYKILQNDFERAAHLLKLHHIDIKDDIEAPKVPLEILEEIIEIREILSEIDDKAKLLELYNQQLLTRENLLKLLAESFDNSDYKGAAIKAMQLKYLDNIIDLIDRG